MSLEGKVYTIKSNFYFVDTQDGLYTCKARGKLKDQGKILVGDQVEVTPTGEMTGVIEEVLPRKNRLLRPLVANISQVVVFLAVRNPDINCHLLDRILVQVELQKLPALICVNKMDLASQEEVKEFLNIYSSIGYKVILTSIKTREGISELKKMLQNNTTVLAGPSGTGKTSFLNIIEPGLGLKTGPISKKVGKGKHTTRQVELLKLQEEGGEVVDTPGFSRLEVTHISSQELPWLFPEINELMGSCRFTSCLHKSEPGCRVKEGLDKGIISPSRYESYLRFLGEIQEKERTFS